MIWIYVLFAGILLVTAAGGENPLAHPILWILGAVIAFHAMTRPKRAPRRAGPPSGRAGAGLDMFQGLRNWSEQECPAVVATATCSLSGRGDDYLRALLVVATLRGDEPGRIVAAAARRILRHSPGGDQAPA